jgi:AraC-like DNA-binding protein
MGIPLRARAATPSWSSVWEESRHPEAAADLVESAWSGRAGRDGSLRVFPDGCTDLTWDGVRLRAVSGRATRLVDVRLDRPSDGVRLRCGATAAVLGAAATIPDVVDLRDLAGTRAVAALERDLRTHPDDARRRDLLLRWVSDRTVGPAPLPSSVADALAVGTPPPAVAADHGLSARSLQREVRASTGMSPKALGRVLRFRRFLTESVPLLAAGRLRLADAAAELGHADQSHLGRGCRAITGTTPASLVRAWRCAGCDLPTA